MDSEINQLFKEQNGSTFQESCLKYGLTFRKVAYDKPFMINTNYRYSFLRKLLTQVDKCPVFEGKAVLKHKKQSKKQQSQEVQPLQNANKKTIEKMNEYFISYHLDLTVRQPLNQQKSKTILQFQRFCDRIHTVIEIIMHRYSLQSKTSFWLSKLKEELNKMNKLREQQMITLEQATQKVEPKVDFEKMDNQLLPQQPKMP